MALHFTEERLRQPQDLLDHGFTRAHARKLPFAAYSREGFVHGRKGVLRQASAPLGLRLPRDRRTHLLARLESTDAVSQWMQQEEGGAAEVNAARNEGWLQV